jgi:S-sulfo-L-cysteine synthase (O-acetyl-L-serine-dependent)
MASESMEGSPLRFPDRRSQGPVSVADLVGNTPLLHCTSLSRQSGIPVYAKAEWTNPGGSVKDRPARHIIREAIQQGRLVPGGKRRLLDATSGNTGIAYATIAPSYKIQVTLCVPANVSRERQQILKALGVELILTDPLDASDGAIIKARELAKEHPGRYVYVDQYSNEANWRSHFETTGPEIWRQTQNRVTHFVAGLGTTGTLVGTGRYLKEVHKDIHVVAVEPDGPLHGLEGLKHLESAIVPEIWDPGVPERRIGVATEAAQGMAHRFAQEEGLLLGPSGGAAAIGALQVAKGAAKTIDAAPVSPTEPAPGIDNTPSETPVVVTVFPDNATKYLSLPFWEASH